MGFITPVLKFLVLGTSGVSIALVTDIIPKVPVTNDPLAWAFMSAVALVLGCAVWVVRFVLTTYVKKLDDISLKLTDVVVEQRLLSAKILGYIRSLGEDR